MPDPGKASPANPAPPLDGATVYRRTAPGYASVRQADPRIAERIAAALGITRPAGPGERRPVLLNVGAGTGSYEAELGAAIALEPSREMLGRRPPEAAPAVRGRAEALPFASRSVDVAIALLSVHHWSDLAGGLAELRRVARRTVALFHWDPAFARSFWLTEYLPAELVSWDAARMPALDRLCELLPGARVEAVPIPHDCRDGFMAAYWRRPAAYLSPDVRAGISSLSAWPGSLEGAWQRLRADLDSGAWTARFGHLLGLEELDLGYRVIVTQAAEAGALPPRRRPPRGGR